MVSRIRSCFVAVAVHAVTFCAAWACLCCDVRSAEGDAIGKKSVPARTAVLARSADEPHVPVREVDWSGYRGIRRYSPYYYPAYAGYAPYYYGNYAYRPWYARPYAYAYGYPGYAGPFYRGWYPRFGYPAVGYPAYAPYAWGGFFAPPVVGPFVPAVVGPQVSSTGSAVATDYVGCYYW